MVAPVAITQSVVAGKVPLTVELVIGGLAINLADHALYSMDNDGNVFRIDSGETADTIKTKLGITTLSGNNTGDQTLASLVSIAAVNAASTDLATVIALCNQLRSRLIANGMAS